MQVSPGKILCIRLWNKSFRVWETKEKLYKHYIAGCGIGVKILHDMTGPNTDTLGAYNPIVWMTGPLTFSEAISPNRYHVVSRSPLTGKIEGSSADGLFGAALKKAGWNGLVVTGVSDTPVSIVIKDDDVRIVPAEDIWGKDTLSVDEQMKKQYGKECEVSCIGRAGESLISIAGIASGAGNLRMAGRGGLGAVMGSKKLKAVVVTGTRYLEVGNKAVPNIPKDATVNKNYFCASCYMDCRRNPEMLSEKLSNSSNFEANNEILKLMRDSTMVKDSESIKKAVGMCSLYGIDAIDAAAVIFIAMECYEKGFLTVDDLDGIKAEWGNGDALVALTNKICKAEGIGELLGHGVAFVLRRVTGAAMLGFNVKGLSDGYSKIQKDIDGNKDKYYKYFLDRLKNRNDFEKSRKKSETVDFASRTACINDAL